MRYKGQRLPKTCFLCLYLLASACSEAKNTGANSIQPTPNTLVPGIIAFGSSDSAVIFSSSLTSKASITSAQGFEEMGSDNQFDSTLGMKPGAQTDGTPGCLFSAASIAALTDLPEGQLSIEVEREWLGVTDDEVRSFGYQHNDNEYLLSFASSIIDPPGRLYLQPDQGLIWFLKAGEGHRRNYFVNTDRSQRFTRITISWTTDQAKLYADGLLVTSLPQTDQSADRFSEIHIGNLMGSTNYSFRGEYFVRNLVIASRPVTTSTIPLLQHVMHIGDSFAAGQPFVNVATKYDGTIANTVIKKLVTTGAEFNRYTVYSNGGGKIQDNNNDPLEFDVNGGGLTRTDALLEDPSLIVFITGGNDTSIFSPAEFTIDLHDHIESFLGENGHPTTNVKYVIVTTTTSNALATDSVILNMVQIMRDLPAWWDRTYPSRKGAVSIIDTWSLFGAENVDSTLFGTQDPVHPAASGNIVYGNAIADQILKLIQQSKYKNLH